MKKHLYAFLILSGIAFSTQAQFIKKGDVLLGGNLGFSTSKSAPEDQNGNYQSNQSNVSLSPSIGKAIKNDLVEGVDLLYMGSSASNWDGMVPPTKSTVKSYTYGAGFFLRRYKSLGAGFAVFMQGRLGGYYNIQKEQVDPGGADFTNSRSYQISLGFYPGIAYAISKRVQLETGFQNLVQATYEHDRTMVQDPGNINATVPQNTNSFSLATGLSNSLQGFVIGFRVLLGHAS